MCVFNVPNIPLNLSASTIHLRNLEHFEKTAYIVSFDARFNILYRILHI